MPTWLFPVLALAGVALTAAGALVGSVLTYRVQRRASDAAAATANAAVVTANASAENGLVDQLQEELAGYRVAADRRATAQDERMNRIEKQNDGYRTYAHELRAHIWDGKTPPPPAWPTGLPQ